MTNQQIMDIAMTQSAMDCNCKKEDFLGQEPVIAESAAHPGARRYLTLPFSCHLVSYGSNVVASVQGAYRQIAEDYVRTYPPAHCFETPNLHVLNDALQEKGQRICFMAEYFLPDAEAFFARTTVEDTAAGYELRLLYPEDLAECYGQGTWDNALCQERKQLDVLGVGAFDRGKLVGLAGCSADCDSMWQIGIDVLPEYRRKGLASALTRRLALETFARGKVPFYCAAWCNIPSVRNAIRSGFRPAWVEMTAKAEEFVAERNGQR